MAGNLDPGSPHTYNQKKILLSSNNDPHRVLISDITFLAEAADVLHFPLLTGRASTYSWIHRVNETIYGIPILYYALTLNRSSRN